MSRASRRARAQQRVALARSTAGPTVDLATTPDDAPVTVSHAEQTVRIDVTKLEVPHQLYDADCVWVVHRPGKLSLMFGKVSLDEPSVFARRLEVRYPVEMFANNFWENSQDFFASLERHLTRWPAPAHELVAFDPAWPARESHSEWANFTYLSYTGTEAAFDFYHLSTATMARINRDPAQLSHLKLRPVVRVHTSSFELKRLAATLQPVIAEIHGYMPDRKTSEPVQVVTGTE